MEDKSDNFIKQLNIMNLNLLTHIRLLILNDTI